MVRLILSEVVRLAAPAVALFLALFLASTVMERQAGTETRLDSARASASFLSVEPAYVAFRSSLLRGDAPAILLIGPSNVKTGLRPDQIAALLPPGVAVHNLAVSGTNIDGMGVAVDLAYAQRPPGSRDNLVFVLGLWFGEFLHSESNPMATPLALQMMRFGLFRHSGDGFALAGRRQSFDLTVQALRPFFFLQNILGSQGMVAGWLPGAEPAAMASAPPPEDLPLPMAQFDEMVAIADKIARHGGKLVLLDLPVNETLSRSDPRWTRYQSTKLPMIAAVQSRGGAYIDMQDMNAAADFADGTHPKPATTPRWAARLVAGLAGTGVIPASRVAPTDRPRAEPAPPTGG